MSKLQGKAGRLTYRRQAVPALKVFGNDVWFLNGLSEGRECFSRARNYDGVLNAQITDQTVGSSGRFLAGD
jgi:hypothetical protein